MATALHCEGLPMDFDQLVPVIRQLALQAGERIMQV